MTTHGTRDRRSTPGVDGHLSTHGTPEHTANDRGTGAA